MNARRTSIAFAAAAMLWALAAEPGSALICPSRGRRCSTPPPTRAGGPKAELETEAAIAAAGRLQAGERIVVPVVYHVMYDVYVLGPSAEPDDLDHTPPLVLIERQTEVLNWAFRGTGISFVPAGVEVSSFDVRRTTSAPGSEPSDDELAGMMVEEYLELQDALHVYLIRSVENISSSPHTRRVFDNFPSSDGILMNRDYLPYDPALFPVADAALSRLHGEGEMLVHLVGHWFGLLHTFQGSPGPNVECRPRCGQTSDFVLDTPIHRLPRAEIDRCYKMDTCPSLPGLDPIHNFMNLVPDFCASELTPGQVERIDKMVRAYRCQLIQPRPLGCGGGRPGVADGDSKR